MQDITDSRRVGWKDLCNTRKLEQKDRKSKAHCPWKEYRRKFSVKRFLEVAWFELRFICFIGSCSDHYTTTTVLLIETASLFRTYEFKTSSFDRCKLLCRKIHANGFLLPNYSEIISSIFCPSRFPWETAFTDIFKIDEKLHNFVTEGIFLQKKFWTTKRLNYVEFLWNLQIFVIFYCFSGKRGIVHLRTFELRPQIDCNSNKHKRSNMK